MQKVWEILPANKKLSYQLSSDLNIDAIIAQILINRNIFDSVEAKQFLDGEISGLFDPFLMKDMDLAVSRIKKASEQNEKVLVFGDYDVDGVTSSAILYTLLTKMGIKTINHIPHRMDHGYGLNEDVIKLIKKENVSLLIAVDCGITAIEEVANIQKNGIDVIIFDHHEPSDEGIPDAVAVVDPKRKDCPYPFKYLASVGLVAKLSIALFGTLDDEILGLTAMGTVADVVPMQGENRIFVKQGLEKLDKIKNKGLIALIDVSKIKNKKLNNFHVGFVLGPRINAAGRMDSAHESLDLLLTKDTQEAYKLAEKLDRYNNDRKRIQRDIIKEALEIVEKEINFNEHKVIVISKKGWHKGLLGIVASRITEKYYRPTIIISLEDGVGTASARSIDGFHLYDALATCNQFLERFGGHKGAAGLTIKEENIDSFRNLINEVAKDALEIKRLVPTVTIDLELNLSSLNLKLANTINTMDPFGEGNPEPVFSTCNLRVKGMPRILGKDTIKFWVTDGKKVISAVGFGMANCYDVLSSGVKIDLAYNLSIDDWNKSPVVQLKLKDIRVSVKNQEFKKEERLLSRS